MVRLKPIEEPHTLEEVHDLIDIVMLPAYTFREVLPEIDVVVLVVFFEEVHRLEMLVEVNPPVHGAWVLSHVLQSQLFVVLLDHGKEVKDGLLVFHDDSVGV